MKKSVYLLGIVLAVLSVFFLFSCSNIADKEEEFKAVLTAEESKSERAYIRVNVENTDSAPTRTLLPKIELSNLILTGSREGGEAQVLATASALAEMSAKQIEIQTGNWAFTLTATVSGVAYSSGEVSKTIESGGENPLSFTLEPADGATTGTLDFSLTFTGTEGVDYEVIVNDFPLSDTQKSGDTIIWKESGLTPGTHALKIEFRAKNANNSSSPLSEVLNTYKSVFLIEKGITTKAEVTNFNLNQVYSITYDGYEPTTNADVPVADALDPTDSVMTLKFSRKAGAGTDGYIPLPKLSNSTMTFSGWYTSADFAEASKVPESGTAPNTVQKIKATENLANLKLYAKWLVEAAGSIYSPTDYEFTIKTSAKRFTPGTETAITIKPNITPAIKINDENLAWAASLWCENSKVCELSPELAASNLTVTIPESVKFEDTYVLKITATYFGVAHDASFILDGNTLITVASLSDVPTAAEYPELGLSSEDELKKIAEWVTTSTLQNITFILTKDIELTEPFTTAIGSGSTVGNRKEFKGTFDGADHTISGFNSTGQTTLYPALFGFVGAVGTVKNLILEGTSICSGIAGYSVGTIENCESRVTINVTPNVSAGGIVASLRDGGTIKNCKNSGNITNASNLNSVGGIAGEITNAPSAIIDSCVNTGNITGRYVAGGITGSNFKIVRNCINTGIITSNASSGGRAGGISGNTYCSYTDGDENCANFGTVSGKAEVGGITGTTDISGSYNAYVVNCYNAGSVISSGSNGSIVGEIKTGGTGTCTFTHNYYRVGTAIKGVNGKSDSASNSTSVPVSTSASTIAGYMNEWLSTNNSAGNYKTWTTKTITLNGESMTVPVPDVGFDW